MTWKSGKAKKEIEEPVQKRVLGSVSGFYFQE